MVLHQENLCEMSLLSFSLNSVLARSRFHDLQPGSESVGVVVRVVEELIQCAHVCCRHMFLADSASQYRVKNILLLQELPVDFGLIHADLFLEMLSHLGERNNRHDVAVRSKLNGIDSSTISLDSH